MAKSPDNQVAGKEKTGKETENSAIRLFGCPIPLKISSCYPWIFTVPLLLCAYATGLFFRGTNTIWFSPSLICLLVIALLALWPGLKAGWAVPKAPVFSLAFLFGLYIWLSTLWATVPYNAILFAMILSVLPFLFMVFVLSPAPLKGLRIHGATLGIASCILAGWALIQYFFFIEMPNQRVHHPMLNPNNLAVMLNMGFLPALALYFLSKKQWAVIATYLLVILFAGALIVTQSRGAVLSFIIAFIVLITVCRGAPGMNKKRFIAFLTGLVCTYLIISNYKYGLFSLEQPVIGEAALSVAMNSVTDRLALWSSAWEIILDHFWLGTGLGTFYYFYPAYRLPTDRSDGFFVHMDPLQFWQEMGIMAPILFYIFLIAVLVRTIRAIIVLPKDSDTRFEVIAPFCALLALLLHTHITFHLYILITLIPASLLLAYWFVATEKALGTDRFNICPGSIRKRIIAGTGGLLLFAVTGIWLVQALLGIIFINKANIYLQKGEATPGHYYVLQARRYAPNSYSRPFEYEAKYRYALLTDTRTKRSRAEREILYRETHEFLDEAEKRNPVFAQLWNLRALLYFIARGEFEPDGLQKSIKVLEKTVAFNPLMADARMGLAKAYNAQGRDRKALEILEAGLMWPQMRSPLTLNYYVMIAKLRLQMGDKKGHDQMIAAAVRFAKQIRPTKP